jgi:hypothetical protein
MAATITLIVSSYNGKSSSNVLEGLTLKESTGQLEETARELLQIEDEIKFTPKIKKSDSPWMALDISNHDIELGSCNIQDGDTVALEEITGIEVAVEAGAASGDPNVGCFYVANARDKQHYIEATPDSTAPTEIQGKSTQFGGFGIDIANMGGHIGEFFRETEKVPLHTPEPKIETSKFIPAHQHLRIEFTINNPKNPKPCNIQIGVDKDQLETKEVIRNGFGIILTPKHGIKPTQKIDKIGKNAWKPWDVPQGEDRSTFSYKPHQSLEVGDICSICQFERKKRPRSLLDNVMNRNK